MLKRNLIVGALLFFACSRGMAYYVPYDSGQYSGGNYENQIQNVAGYVQSQNPCMDLDRFKLDAVTASAGSRTNVYWRAVGTVMAEDCQVSEYSTDHGWLVSRMQYPAGSQVGTAGVLHYVDASNANYQPQATNTVTDINYLQ